MLPPWQCEIGGQHPRWPMAALPRPSSRLFFKKRKAWKAAALAVFLSSNATGSTHFRRKSAPNRCHGVMATVWWMEEEVVGVGELGHPQRFFGASLRSEHTARSYPY